MKRKLYKEVVSKDGKILNCKEQEDPYLMAKVISTKLVKATDDEVEDCKRKFKENGECEYHLIYDEHSISFSSRYCGICNKFIALI